MTFKPERTGSGERIYPGIRPPGPFITAAMEFAVMHATERDRELITHLTAERAGLSEAEMMGIRRPPTANKTGLFDHVPDMVAITNTARFREDEDALVDL